MFTSKNSDGILYDEYLAQEQDDALKLSSVIVREKVAFLRGRDYKSVYDTVGEI
ncbi:MAG: hypothetical protein GY796_30890 [Chloroflexi bacterium]|nr:hypothetical protein [Chloroflexota bacterium]